MATATALMADLDSRGNHHSGSVMRNHNTANSGGRQSMKKKKSGPGGKRPGSGAKPKYGDTMRNIALRATDDQRSNWERAADAAGLSLSEWIRAVCDQAAESS